MSILDKEKILLENTELPMCGFPDKNHIIKINCNYIDNRIEGTVNVVKSAYAYNNDIYFKKYWREYLKKIEKQPNKEYYYHQSKYRDRNNILSKKIIVVDWLNFRLNKNDDYKYAINARIFFTNKETYDESVDKYTRLIMKLPIIIITNTEDEAQNTSYELITLFKDNPQLVINLYDYELNNGLHILHTIDEIKQFI